MTALAERLDAASREAVTPPVLVVGAGPVGVTVATMLAARGVAVVVVDRHHEVYPLPRAVHVDDEIRRVLQGLDPSASLDPLMMPTGGLRLLDAQHRTMAEFNRNRPVGEHGHPQANMYDQPDLERWLRERLAGRPRASLLGGVELTALDRTGGLPTVEATLTDPATGETARLAVSAVLGCDGANSIVRDIIGARMLDLRFEERWLVVDVRSPHPLDAWLGVHQVCDHRRAATFMQVSPGRYRWEFRLKDGEQADDLLAQDRLAGLVRPWTGDLPFAEMELLRSAEYVFKARIADRWRDGRVFLLGDAAHLTPPFIGQGLCSGIRDAANLSWKLADVLAGRLDASVLDTYEAERAPHARALIGKAVLVGRVMTGGQDAAAVVRKVALTGLCRIPAVATGVLDAPSPPLRPGPLVRRHRRDGRRTRAGHLVPQPRVRTAVGDQALDAVLGDGFALLTLDPPAPALLDAAAETGAVVLHVRAASGSRPASGAGAAGVRTVEDIDGVLTTWLAGGRARTVLVRPDRVVADQDRAADGGARLAARLAAWSRTHRPAAAPDPAVAPAPSGSVTR